MPIRMTFSAVRSNVRRAPNKKIHRLLEQYTERFLAHNLLSEVVYYPPVPPGSWYTRTFTLLQSWKVRPISKGKGIRYEVFNDATDPKGRHYARLVHGPTGQWPHHAAHGWRNIGESLELIGGRGRFRQGVQNIINRNLAGEGYAVR